MVAASEQPILIVEDSEIDFQLVCRAFHEVGVKNPIFHCDDGDSALDFLYHRGVYDRVQPVPRPTVVLLDLNLPGTDGREVIAEVKQDEGLKTIPIIVMTTSDHPADVQACYQAGANSYVKKPLAFDDLVKVARRIKGFWFELVTYPR